MKNIEGKVLQVQLAGKEIEVLQAKWFEKDQVGKPFKEVLKMAPDQIIVFTLGAKKFPVVVLKDGVAQLKKIKIDGVEYSQTTQMADALGLEPRCPASIKIK